LWNFSLVWNQRAYMLTGTLYTLLITFGAAILGIALGLLLGMGRISRNRFAAGLATVYVTVIRGTPMLLQILFVFLGVPQVFQTIAGRSLNMDPVVTGILALGLNSAAYVAEIVRGGIQSIDKGQMEAARSLGLSYQQAMRHVILPQAFRRIIPPLANEFIVLLKDSSLVSVIGAYELMYRGKLMGSKHYAYIPFLVGAAAIYLSLTIIFTHLVSRLERRLAVSD